MDTHETICTLLTEIGSRQAGLHATQTTRSILLGKANFSRLAQLVLRNMQASRDT
jgi:hypothetical protein